MIRTTTLCTSLVCAILSTTSVAQEARVQLIHNSAQLDLEQMDIYLDGELLRDDLSFRKSTEFLVLPADVELSFAVAHGSSNAVDEALFTEAITFQDGGTYIIVANGLLEPSGYTPETPFSLDVFDQGREAAVENGVDLLVMHGATDAPVIDIYERNHFASTLVDDMAYGDFAGYLNSPATDLQLEIRTAAGMTTGMGFLLPLASMDLSGSALTIVASGFLDTGLNHDGAAFGLWMASADGGGLLELEPIQISTGTATVQVIHNSADALASVVDIYVNGNLAIPDLAFRTATAQLNLPAGIDLTIGVAPGNSTGPEDIVAGSVVNLDANTSYRIIANGIISPTGYDPAPPFALDVFTDARTAALVPTNTDVLVYHGSTDAPTVDINETSVPLGVLANDISYSEFQGYQELPTADYELEVSTTDGSPVVRYDAPLESLGLQGAAITVLASGFLDPGMNSGGPSFGLWVALPSGGELIPLPLSVGIGVQEARVSAHVFPNPSNGELYIDLRSERALPTGAILTDMSGRQVAHLSTSELVKGGTVLRMDLSGIGSGLYTLNLIHTNGVQSIPVQVVR